MGVVKQPQRLGLQLQVMNDGSLSDRCDKCLEANKYRHG